MSASRGAWPLPHSLSAPAWSALPPRQSPWPRKPAQRFSRTRSPTRVGQLPHHSVLQSHCERSNPTSGIITIPATKSSNPFTYTIDGANAASGPHAESAGNHTVVANILNGHTLRSGATTSWAIVIDATANCGAPTPVTPATPSVNQPGCDGAQAYSGYITIPATTGVDYLINGTVVAAGYYDEPAGDYTVTAQAQKGYVLPSGAWSWVFTVDPTPTCVTTPPPTDVQPGAPTATQPTCAASGYITIPSTVGVDYFIDGSPAAAGQHKESTGTYTVTAQPQQGYTFGETQSSWQFTIHAKPICSVVVQRRHRRRPRRPHRRLPRHPARV